VVINMRKSVDRTAELNAKANEFKIWCNDFCDFFEQDESRLFTFRECWYCKYGDFGIYNEHSTKNGVCKLKITKNNTYLR